MIVDARNSKLDAVRMDPNDDHLVTSTMEIEQNLCLAEVWKDSNVSGDFQGKEARFASANPIQDEKQLLLDDSSTHRCKSKESGNNFAPVEAKIVEPPINISRTGGEMQVLGGNRAAVECGEKIFNPLPISDNQNGFPPQDVSNPLGTLVSHFAYPQGYDHFPQTGPVRSVEEEAQRRYLEFLRTKYPSRGPSRPPDNSQAFQHSRNIPQTTSTSLMNDVERQHHIYGSENLHEGFSRQLNNFQHFRSAQTNLTQTSVFSLPEGERQNCDMRSLGNQNTGISRPFNNYQEFHYSGSIPQTNLNRNLPQASSIYSMEQGVGRQNCQDGRVENHYGSISRQLNNGQEFQQPVNIPQTNLTRNLQQTSSGVTGNEFGWQNCSSSGNRLGVISRQLDNRQEFLHSNLIGTPQTNLLRNLPQTNSILTEKEGGRQNCKIRGLENPDEGISRQLNNFQKFQHPRSTPQTNFIPPQPSLNTLTETELARRNCVIGNMGNHYESFSTPHDYQEFQHISSIPPANPVANFPQTRPINLTEEELERQNYKPRSGNQYEVPAQQHHTSQEFQHFRNNHPSSARNPYQPDLSDWAVKEIHRMNHEMRSLKKQYEGFLKQHNFLQEFQRFRSAPETTGNPPQIDPTNLMVKEIERLKYEMRSLSNQYKVCARRLAKLQEFWRLRSSMETNSIRNLLQSNPIHSTEKGVERQNHNIRSGNHCAGLSRQGSNMQGFQHFNIPQTSQSSAVEAQNEGRNSEARSLQTSFESFPKRKNSSLAEAPPIPNSKKKILNGNSIAGTRLPPYPRHLGNVPFVQESKTENLGGSSMRETRIDSHQRQENGFFADASFVQESKQENLSGSSVGETKSELFIGQERVIEFAQEKNTDYLVGSSLTGIGSESSTKQENSSQTKPSFSHENPSGRRVAETKSESPSRQQNGILAEATLVKKNEILTESSVVGFGSNSNAESLGEEPVSCPDCPSIFQGTAALSCRSRINNNVEFFSCPACSIRVDSQEQLVYHLRCDHLKISGLQWYQCEVCEARFRCLLAFVTHLRGMHADEYYFRAMCQRCLCTLESDRQLKSLLAMVRDSCQSNPCSVKSANEDESDGLFVSPAQSPDCDSGSPEIKLIDLTEAEKEDSDVIQIFDFFMEESEDEDNKVGVRDSLLQAVEEAKSVKKEISEQKCGNSLSGLAQADSSQQIDLIDLTEDEIKDLETCQSVDSFSKDSEQEDSITGFGGSLSEGIEGVRSRENIEREGTFAENPANGSTTADYSVTNALVCSYCPAEFSHKDSLTEHALKHFQSKAYKCPCCGKHYKHEQSFYSHLKCHKMELPYQCKFCLQRLDICCDLTTHLKTAHSDEYWLPGDFSLVKPRQNAKQRDLNPGGPAPNIEFPRADIQIESVYHLPGAFHSESRVAEEVCLCDVCGERFSTRNDLLSHLKTRHPGEYQNAAKFSSEEWSLALIPESFSHTGYHNCPYCPVQLSSGEALSVHVKSSHAEKSCPPSESNRDREQNQATGIGPPNHASTTHLTLQMYFCWFCRARFCVYNSYKNHLKSSHSSAVLQRCPFTGDPSSSEFLENCVKAVCSMHGPAIQVECPYRFDGNSYWCPFCRKRYLRRVPLVKHFMEKHPNFIMPLMKTNLQETNQIISRVTQ